MLVRDLFALWSNESKDFEHLLEYEIFHYRLLLCFNGSEHDCVEISHDGQETVQAVVDECLGVLWLVPITHLGLNQCRQTLSTFEQ